MKKGILVLMAVALLIPLSSMAQDETPNEFFGPFGGRGPGMMGQGHPGPDCDGSGPGAGRRDDGIHRLLMVADEIGLTDQQQEQLKELALAFKMRQIDRKAEMEKARVNLHSLRLAENLDDASVLAAIDDLAELKAEMQKARYLHHKEVKSVLTEEQVEKLKELRKTRREEMRQCEGRGFRGKGGHGGQGGRGRP